MTEFYHTEDPKGGEGGGGEGGGDNSHPDIVMLLWDSLNTEVMTEETSPHMLQFLRDCQVTSDHRIPQERKKERKTDKKRRR